MKRLSNKRVCSQERTEFEDSSTLRVFKLKKHKTNEVEEEKAEVEVEMDGHDSFDVLPNEMVELILLQHLHQPWHIVCKSVCTRWRSILSNASHTAEKCSSMLAKEGHLKVLQWARSQGCPWNKQICSKAARGGHLEVLQWARSQGCPWDGWTCAGAARGGHLEVLQWARSQGCPWNEWTCTNAARKGHLEVLQWARGQGCPWNEDTCTNAARGGHLEVLQWARG